MIEQPSQGVVNREHIQHCSRQRNMLRTSALSVLLLLATQLMAGPTLASLLATDFNKHGVTAQDFKALAQATTSDHGGKRALLQSTAFSQNFYLILEAILEGNSGDKTFHD